MKKSGSRTPLACFFLCVLPAGNPTSHGTRRDVVVVLLLELRQEFFLSFFFWGGVTFGWPKVQASEFALK